MENNMAVVCILRNIQPIPEADKIVQADVILEGVKLTQVVVGKETVEGTMVVYFDSNLCLSEELLKDYPDLGAYLGKGNRVKAVKLKGVISNGLAVEVEKFYQYTAGHRGEKLDQGFSFNELDFIPICKKYVPEVQRGSGGPNAGKGRAPTRLIPDQWRFHRDTDNLLKNLKRINPTSVISISRKVHGTSSITGKIMVKSPVPAITFKERVAAWFGVVPASQVQGTTYDYIYGSRNTVKNGLFEAPYSLGFWGQTGKKYFEDKLRNGETVYYEIIGYQPGGGFVQKNYDYGCKPGESKIQVYRITATSTDGHVVEYGWQAMKERCQELGIETVEEFYFGRAADYPLNDGGMWEPPAFIDSTSYDETALLYWRQALLHQLKNDFLEKDAWDCAKKGLPDEGVVIRVEGLEIEAYKLKSERFVLQESASRDKGEVDLEDQEAASGE